MECKVLQNFVISSIFVLNLGFMITSSFLLISTTWLLMMLKSLLIIEYMMALALYETLGLQDASGYNFLAFMEADDSCLYTKDPPEPLESNPHSCERYLQRRMTGEQIVIR